QYGVVDGIGSAARFGGPMGLALDGTGNLYVADDAGNVIRRVELATANVTTISGTPGVAGFANGAAAQYAVPAGLAYDPAGFLYIADSNNGLIRKLDLSNNVASTLNSDFLFPVGLAFDGTQYLYVADGRAESVGRVDVKSGLSTALAGGGEAGFLDGIGGHLFNVNQIALDPKSNTLRIADWRVRTLDLQNLALASQEVDHEGIGYGIAIDENGNTLFSFNDAIVRVDAAGNGYQVVAGVEANIGYVDATGGAARFANPRALATDGNGTLFVTDPGNTTVRQVALATGQASTLVGSPWLVDADGVGAAGRLHYPQNVVSDGNGTLYIVETDTDLIRKYVIATSTLTTLAGRANRAGNDDGPGATAKFYNPMGACLDSGFLYVADSQNQTIRRVDVTSGVVTTIAGLVEQPGAVDAIGTNAQFNLPEDVKCDGAGHLYVADWRNDAIRRVTLANNNVDTVVGRLMIAGATDGVGGAARLYAPVALALNATTLFIADAGNDSIREARLSDFNVTTRVTKATGRDITGIAVDSANLVYFSSDTQTIHSVDASGTIALVAGTPNAFPASNGQGAAGTFSMPLGIWLDMSGVFVADHGEGTVRHIDLPAANVTTLVGNGWSNLSLAGTGTAANVLIPHGIAFNDGALYVGDDGGSVLDRIDPASGILTIAAGQPKDDGWDSGPVATAHIETVSSVAFDGKGALYMGDSVGCTIRSIVGGQLTTLAGMTATGSGSVGSTDGTGAAARFNTPEGIALDGAGFMYVADSWNHTIRKVELATGIVTTPYGKAGTPDAVDGLGTDARFDEPLDVVYDAGSLYVADSGNGAIRRIDLTTQMVTTYIGLLGQQGVVTGALPARLNAPRGLIKIAADQWAFIDEQGVFVIR
ncbi:MAG TPA: NHL repeat-containing protein, partial [Polyangia bacterium]|nr:NHL repeat-containing protein [Polyangia bacterium]